MVATLAAGAVSRAASSRPRLNAGGVDIALYVALIGFGVAVSIVGTGRWQRLKAAYVSQRGLATPSSSGGSDRNQQE